MNTKYPSKDSLKDFFEIVDGELWRKEFTNKKGTFFKRKKVENKVNHSNGYCQIRFKRKTVYYHNIIWILSQGDIPEGLVIDHIDGNRINNNIDNLRVVTIRQNSHNQDIHRNGRLFGCSFVKDRNKWRARIRINGKKISLGSYDTEQEAHERYLQELKKVVNA
jgi:hypothetical protein